MACEETKEQQQMYNYFRSCIYFFLIIEIVMNLLITPDNKITQFILDLLRNQCSLLWEAWQWSLMTSTGYFPISLLTDSCSCIEGNKFS